MEILVCGTGAAEGIPALFCVCAVCQEARKRGGAEIRSRSAYQLGEKTRLDFGPDSHWHSQRYGLAFERLETLLITHSHSDHFYPTDLQNRRKGMSVVAPGTTLEIWGNATVEAQLRAELGADLERYFLRFRLLTPWQPIPLPDGGEAIPLPARHDPNELCVNYIVRHGEQAALFGHDTGWYAEETWERLQDYALDCVFWDTTYAVMDHDRNHMGGLALVRARDLLRKQGTLKPDGRCFVTHFSHNGGALHSDLEAFFAPHEIGVAYDGLNIAL